MSVQRHLQATVGSVQEAGGGHGELRYPAGADDGICAAPLHNSSTAGQDDSGDAAGVSAADRSAASRAGSSEMALLLLSGISHFETALRECGIAVRRDGQGPSNYWR